MSPYLNAETQLKVSFNIESFEDDFFFVRLLKGIERVSQCYEFYIEFICPLTNNEKKLDINDIYSSNITLKIGNLIYSCIVESLEFISILQKPYDSNGVFKATLAPRLKQMDFARGDTAYLSYDASRLIKYLINQNIPDYADFMFESNNTYIEKGYFTQFDETDLNFLNRICEKWGIYYTFTSADKSERVVFSDSKSTLDTDNALFLPFCNDLNNTSQADQILSFTETTKNIPSKVIVKGYNFQSPEATDLIEELTTSSSAFGETVTYSENIISAKEVKLFAKVKKEALLSMGNQFHATSTAPIRPGQCAKITSHPIYEDTPFQIISVDHFVDQTNLLKSDLKQQFPLSDAPIYTNEFIAISTEVQFRSMNKAKRSKIQGHLSARISTNDKLKNNEELETDAENPNPAGTSSGRYFIQFNMAMVINPDATQFDTVVPVRQMKSFTGNQHGISTPLQENDEVLVSFINADPDCPIIIGRVPNSSVYMTIQEEIDTIEQDIDNASDKEKEKLEEELNELKSNLRSIHKTVFKSMKESEILFSDKDKHKGILLKTEYEETRMALGNAAELIGIEEIKEELESEESIKKIVQYIPAYLPRLFSKMVDPEEAGVILTSEKRMTLETDTKMKYINGDSLVFVEEIVQEIILLDYLRTTIGYYSALTLAEVEFELTLNQIIKTIWHRVHGAKNEYKAFNADVNYAETIATVIHDRIVAEAGEAVDRKLDSIVEKLEAKAETVEGKLNSITTIVNDTEEIVTSQEAEDDGIRAQITEVEERITGIDTHATNTEINVILSINEEVGQDIQTALQVSRGLLNHNSALIVQ